MFWKKKMIDEENHEGDEYSKNDTKEFVRFLGNEWVKQYKIWYTDAKRAIYMRRQEKRNILDFTLRELLEIYQKNYLIIWHRCLKLWAAKRDLYQFLEEVLKNHTNFVDECNDVGDFLSEMMTDEEREKKIIFPSSDSRKGNRQ